MKKRKLKLLSIRMISIFFLLPSLINTYRGFKENILSVWIPFAVISAILLYIAIRPQMFYE